MRARLVSLIFTAVVVAANAGAQPVIFAVDTSRSLRASEIEAARKLVAEVTGRLPEESEVALMAFNDAPAWLAPPGSSRTRVLATVPELAPAGRFTLLHDALFTAARALPGGGVIVLLTDGLDENSATTLEDVARLCEVNRVRIVAVGLGRQLDERTLRRLALLSRGSYAGVLGAGSVPAVLRHLEEARAAVAAEVAPTPTPPPPPTPAPAPEPVTAPAASFNPALVAVGVVALLGLAIGVALWLRQRAEERRRRCERCGAPLAEWEVECARCALPEAHALSETAGAATAAEAPETVLDPEVFAKQPLQERLDRTFVLDEQAVVVVKEPRKVPRTFVLPLDKAFALGRAQGPNTVAIADPTVSGQHLKIVHKDGAFFLVDLGSTNGTRVNGVRVRSAQLKPGDVIRAGEVELEFRLQLRSRGM
ncbi:MAG: FHA domain-containing protein [Acidobacteriota bacterium]|jgi:hypothetical protein